MKISQFLIIYLLLLVILFLMKKSKVNQSKLLLLASIRMTFQLILAGFVLQFIFTNPNPLFTLIFLVIMVGFSIEQILKNYKYLNSKFKLYISLSLSISGIFVLGFFVIFVSGQSFFNPQYTIPLAGMIIGNAMTGINIGLKSFTDSLKNDNPRISTLLNLGVHPKDILKPLVNNSLETALIPTLNSMLGMGIIFLPGMMTGQILSGTLPTTAIMYQIAIMIAICTSVCLTVFFSLNLGYKTLFNNRLQFKK